MRSATAAFRFVERLPESDEARERREELEMEDPADLRRRKAEADIPDEKRVGASPNPSIPAEIEAGTARQQEREKDEDRRAKESADIEAREGAEGTRRLTADERQEKRRQMAADQKSGFGAGAAGQGAEGAKGSKKSASKKGAKKGSKGKAKK
jgi:hypothetical protein